MNSWSEILWGRNAKFRYLFIAAFILLLTLLSGRDIWTQEHRWADIVAGMFYRHDFLHPYLGDVTYYDKPLLSYWLISLVSFFTGSLSTWELRLPSALAGLLAIVSIYRIGTHVKNKQLGLLSAWLLLTTFYFIFWARTSSADMLNMAGSLFAVSWYLDKKSKPSFLNYTIFFLILTLTSLCKGLVGIIVPLLILMPDLVMNGEWKKHLRWEILISALPALVIYVLPFWASSHFGGESYQQSGLYLVYRENILRYFQPFDHQGPIYTYFIFLPIYLLPWAFFFIPALLTLKSRWKELTPASKWLVWSVLLLFLFFTLSGSRRNYYVLPIVPFAILLTSDWIMNEVKRSILAGKIVCISFIFLFLGFDVIQPLYYAQGGVQTFAYDLKMEVNKIRPWSNWQFVMLDPESKSRFYLELSPQIKNHEIHGNRQMQTEVSLLEAWPILKNRNAETIFITRKIYKPLLKNLLPGYRIVEATPSLGEKLLKVDNFNSPIAFIPNPI